MPDDSDLSLEVKTAEVKTAEVETVEVDEDLALQIARSLPRKGREQITCKRVTKYHYRCNWWTLDDTAAYDNPAMKGSLVTTGRICQSQFLHAVKVDGDLRIRVITR